MLSSDDLARLRCPVTGSALHYATQEQVERINTGIAAGTVLSRISDPISEPIEAGLVNADDSLLYRIEGGIITLLASEAIEIWEHTESA